MTLRSQVLNPQRGFVLIGIIAIVAVLVIGGSIGGASLYSSRKKAAQVESLGKEIRELEERVRSLATPIPPLPTPESISPPPPTSAPRAPVTSSRHPPTQNPHSALPQIAPTPFVEDQTAKIARCEAESRLVFNQTVSKGQQGLQEIFAPKLKEIDEQIVTLQNKKSDEILRYREDLQGLSPSSQSQIRNAAAASWDPAIQAAIAVKGKILGLYEEAKMRTSQIAKSSQDDAYLKCLHN